MVADDSADNGGCVLVHVMNTCEHALIAENKHIVFSSMVTNQCHYFNESEFSILIVNAEIDKEMVRLFWDVILIIKQHFCIGKVLAQIFASDWLEYFLKVRGRYFQVQLLLNQYAIN